MEMGSQQRSVNSLSQQLLFVRAFFDGRDKDAYRKETALVASIKQTWCI